MEVTGDLDLLHLKGCGGDGCSSGIG
jgi:hypothetical protein